MTNPPQEQPESMIPITFMSHGYRLAGNLVMAAEPKELAFLFIQGWAGNQYTMAAQALAGLGFTSMTYDMRGNGDSEGDLAGFSRADFISDAATAYDYLKQHAKSKAIGVVGSSFGGYTAVLLSAERPVQCLSLRVPASYPDEGYNEPQLAQLASGRPKGWWDQPRSYTQNHAFEALHNFAGNVQIVEAGRDEIVPHQTVENFAGAVADKSKLEHVVMRDSPHRLADDRLRADYIKLLTDWAKQQLH